MISISTILTLGFIHFVADFIFQSNYVAQNKSKSNIVLLKHVVIYSLPFILFGSVVFVIINLCLHFVVDYFTSRATSKLWAKGDVHNFFVVIGFDQFLHLCCLVLTYFLIF